MRTIFIAILTFLMFDLAPAQCSMPYFPNVYIPSAGCSSTINVQNGTTYYFSTNGSTALGSNTFIFTYSSLPTPGTTWSAIIDLSNLTTATATNVNIFGITPLASYPGVTHFLYNFTVVWGPSATPVLVVKSIASLYDLANVNNRTTFNAAAYFNDTAKFVAPIQSYGGFQFQPGGAIQANSPIVAVDDSGHAGYGCIYWCDLGNAGTNGSVNFIGTTDTASLSFRVDNLPAGIIGFNKQNTGFGVLALSQNSTGVGNTAIGELALQANTTGSNNADVAGMENSTTGSYNTAIGVNSLGALTTGSYNTAIGQSANVTTATTHNAIAIGSGATAATNQCAIAGVEHLYFNGMNNHLGYALIDTSGNGTFVPQPVPQTTPIIDSVTGTSSQTFTLSNNQTNILTASTTVAGATLAFPTAQSGTIYVIWKVSTTTTTISGTNTGTATVPSTVVAGVSRKYVNLNGNWY